MLKVSNNKITIGTKFKAYNKCQVNRTAAEKKKLFPTVLITLLKGHS